MVAHKRRTGYAKYVAGWAALGLAAGATGTPAFAQDRPGSLLERMQDEVATVARNSRAAIVTIEDSRAITLDYSTSALRETDLKDQIAHLQIDMDAINKEVARRQQLFSAGAMTLSELAPSRREQARLEMRLAYLRARLANVGREDASAQKRLENAERVTELQSDFTLLGKQIETLKAQVNAGAAAPELNEAQRQLDHVRQDLLTAQRQLAEDRVGSISAMVDNATATQKLAWETVLSAPNRTLQAQASLLQAELSNLTEQILIEQARKKAGSASQTDLNELQLRKAQLQRQLNTVRQQLAQNTLVTQPTGTIHLYNTIASPLPPHSGSGFSIGDGYIVTTQDVIQGMNNPVVTTDDGRQVRATLVAVDSRLNIALLRLSANLNLPVLRLGDSANVMAGHFAITMGNQTGQANSVALSTISALRTQGLSSSTHYYPELLQIDGTVSAGTSGAPVLNARGEVIGMLAAMPATTPATDASGFTSGTTYHYEILPGQSPYMPGMSYRYELLPGQSLQRKNLPTTPATKSGSAIPDKLLVVPPSTGSTPESPSKPSGKAILPDSGNRRIQMLGTTGPTTKSDDKMVSSQMPNYFIQRVSEPPFNTPTPVSQPASSNSGFAIPVNAMKSVLDMLKTGHNVVHAWLGMNLEDADHARAENGIVRLDRQVKIMGVYDRSPASITGAVQTGDVLAGMDDTPVHTANDVRSMVLLRFKPGQKIILHLLRAGKPLNVPLTLEAVPSPVPPLLPAPPASVGTK